MFKIAFHPCYVHSLPANHRFPMQKYELVYLQLLHQGLVEQGQFFQPSLIDECNVLLTHDKWYWDKIKYMTFTYHEERRIGFPISDSLIKRERIIAQGTIESSIYAIKNGIALNIAGGTHHAGSNWGEGFCILNDQAISANYLIENNYFSKIMIVDLDVHQGNGTAQIFNHKKNVFTFSMHAENNFPFRKEKSDKDVPLNDGVKDDEYLAILQSELTQAIDIFEPEFVFYLAGADILESDLLGKLKVSKSGCYERDLIVFNICKKRQIPVQVSMGGGYSPLVKDIVDAHCNTFKAAIHTFN